jgi:hypothetical protein
VRSAASFSVSHRDTSLVPGQMDSYIDHRIEVMFSPNVEVGALAGKGSLLFRLHQS